ncbi:MAG: KR domain-containing protein, partial [Rhodobacteraceae bacterium]|nr:KR domain-containing protein [Paracoccaceae bacterium]
FSSMATLIGNHGQSAYVAANGYLEGIARARRAAGLPGLAVGWGAISDVGYLTRDRETAALVRRMSGGTEFTGVQATRALERLLSMGDAVDPVVHVSPMGWNAVSVTLRTLGEPAFGLLRALGRRTEAEAGEDDLRSVLTGMTEARAAERLEGWLVARVAHILQVPEKAVVATKPVADLGVDSLMGVELGLTVQQTLGDDIPVTLISDALSLREIALRIVRHLHGADAAVEERAEEIRMAEQHLGSVAALRETRAEAAE